MFLWDGCGISIIGTSNYIWYPANTVGYIKRTWFYTGKINMNKTWNYWVFQNWNVKFNEYQREVYEEKVYEWMVKIFIVISFISPIL